MITELKRTLGGWLRWLRFRRALTWSQHGLALGLALGLVAGSFGLFEARLLRAEFAALVAGLALVTPLLAACLAYAWPVQTLRAARHFDRVFHLDERVSTAVELDSEQLPSSPLAAQQLDDALAAARRVRPRRDLPLRFVLRDALLSVILLSAIGWVWFRGESWFQAARQTRAVQQAVAAQAQGMQEILTRIQASDTLTEEQKRTLSLPLEQGMQDLQNSSSVEGSISILTSTAEKLQNMSDSQTQGMSQALKDAGQKLSSQDGSPLQEAGKNLAEGDTVQAALQLAQVDPSKMTSSEKEQLAGQLAQMAQSLASADPGLASQLDQAAQALRSGDTEAARQALSQASKSLAQAGQQVEFSQMASQAAGQLQQGASQVLAAGGGQELAQQGQPGAQGQPGSSQSGAPDGASGSGSGKGEAQGSQPGGNEAGSSPIQQNNGPGDGGLTPFEQIYAPTLMGGEGGPTVQLSGSAQGGDVIGQSPNTSTSSGQSLVPYTQALPQYQQANQKAIQGGSIPLQFTQIVRSYFDSLQP